LGSRAFKIQRFAKNDAPTQTPTDPKKENDNRERLITFLIDEDARVVLLPIWLGAISRIDLEGQAIQLPFQLDHRLRFRV
jgi:hypothetical protein